ncbi:MAG: 4-hydroxybenzoate octaprenyltransferase [Bacteroidetes bacterium HGW-Bacteroidetes-22]|nr:MAG: 4-hydroxybenzoate octaprenyltransferase [Bacteroidetes bacterium HGW-Bacteroidetes-22]
MTLSSLSANFKNYFSLVKFSHTLFSMPFAITGYFLAINQPNNHFDLYTLALVLLCVLFARNAAMAFNRYADRQIDAKNPRTQNREIPAKIITPLSAMMFVILNALLFSGASLLLNNLCFILSPVALAIVLGYSYAKRFTSMAHLLLGMGLSLSPIGAYLAVTGEFAMVPVLISFSVLFWVAGFDVIYALQDEEFDRKNGLQSIPSRLGKTKALWVSGLLHVASAGFLISASIMSFNFISWIGTAVFLLLLCYQHVVVGNGRMERINLAFFTLNGIASLAFALFAVAGMI